MDWFCRWSFLLLFTVGSIIKSTVQDTLPRPTVPERVEVCLGSPAIINCTFLINAEGLKVKWFFGHYSPSAQIQPSERFHIEKGKTWTSLKILNVTFNDRGQYFCKLTRDIPVLDTIFSNATQLIVIDFTPEGDPKYSLSDSGPENNTTTAAPATTCGSQDTSNVPSPPWWVWTALALTCVLLIIVGVIIQRMFCRKRESPIYENTRTFAQKDCSPQPRTAAEKGKLSKQTNPLKSHDYMSHPRGR
ncbi:uncharacterized protein [Hoplias malabaricus]|uniref:uncharacterized protein isoform X2 n=1 Tax=Hoplias malabaricus TaxID=27720 RepID=UPI003462CCD3